MGAARVGYHKVKAHTIDAETQAHRWLCVDPTSMQMDDPSITWWH